VPLYNFQIQIVQIEKELREERKFKGSKKKLTEDEEN
jgi:hypothetical protein